MYAILLAIFLLISLLMTFVILIQSSKGGGLAGTFGGTNAMGTVFGGKGAGDFLTKVTAVLAGLFFFIALLMGLMTRGRVEQSSLVEKEREKMMSSPARVLPQVGEPATQQAVPSSGNPAGQQAPASDEQPSGQK